MIKVVNFLMEVLVKIFFTVLFLFVDDPAKDKRYTELIKLYKNSGFGSLFVRIRLWDGPYGQLAEKIPKSGKITDLGCGDGFLVNLLALNGSERDLVGIEFNWDRLKFADKGLKNTLFLKRDIVKYKIPKSNVIILSHVLHHLKTRNNQKLILQHSFQALEKNGQIVIAEINNKPLIKYLFTYITDVITVPILFDGKLIDKDIVFRNANEWKKLLSEVGFKKINITRADKNKPFSNIIITAYS